MSKSTLSSLSRQDLRELAGERYYERGVGYFEEERVRALVVYGEALAATVEGTEDYRVVLRAGGAALEHSCTCPLGEDDAFCKHCVAVGLTWIDKAGGKAARRKARRAVTTLDDVRVFLERQDRDGLVELLLGAALDNERLCERLLTEAGVSFDAEEYRRRFDDYY